MKLLSQICGDLNVPEALLVDAMALAHRRYKKIRIPKRQGGYRTVVQPSAKLKLVQYWLLERVFKTLPVHFAATGFRPGLSILDNAERHQGNRFFVKVDFREFFPSLQFSDFLPVLRDWHRTNATEWKFNAETKKLIRVACFDSTARLPIGYPTSPIIANAIMYKFDSRIEQKLQAKAGTIGNVVYTRYADDMIFSTNTLGASGKILTIIRSTVAKTKSPNLQINEEKTRIASSSGGSAFVTGLRICNDTHITVHREYKDRVRLLLSLYSKKQLPLEDALTLQGHLSHLRKVDPQFFTKVSQRYFSEVNTLMFGGSGKEK